MGIVHDIGKLLGFGFIRDLTKAEIIELLKEIKVDVRQIDELRTQFKKKSAREEGARRISDAERKIGLIKSQASRQDRAKLRVLINLVEYLAPYEYRGEMWGVNYDEPRVRVLLSEKIPLIKKEIDRLLREDFPIKNS